MSKTCYEILVSNEDTADQVVTLLDENYHHPHVTVMAFADGHPVDRCLRSKLKKMVKIDLTRIILGDHPSSIDGETFFKQLECKVVCSDPKTGVVVTFPLSFEILKDQDQNEISQNFKEYALDRDCIMQINMPPLTEIRIHLYLK